MRREGGSRGRVRRSMAGNCRERFTSLLVAEAVQGVCVHIMVWKNVLESSKRVERDRILHAVSGICKHESTVLTTEGLVR